VTVLGLALGEFGFQEEGVGPGDAFGPGQAAQDFSAISRLPTRKDRNGPEALSGANENDARAFDGLDCVRRHSEAASVTTSHHRA
jgi:hypothetical protein